MKRSDILIRYAGNSLTVEDNKRATGISVPSQKNLQHLGIITPEPQGLRTSKRVFHSDVVKRLACIKALAEFGLSLPAAGKIIHASTVIEGLVFPEIDPIKVMFEDQGEIDPWTNLRPLRRHPDPKGWFDPKKPVEIDDTDYFVELLNRRYVRAASADDDMPRIIGEVSPDGSDIVVWCGSAFNSWYGKFFDALFDDAGQPVFRSAEPAFRNFKTKKPTKPDLDVAQHVWRNPTSKVSINVGMTLRAALRRLLLIDSSAEEQD